MERSERGGPRLRLATVTVVVVCLLLGVVSALELRTMSIAHGSAIPWRNVFGTTMPRWMVMSLTLPVALWLATRPRLRGNRRTLILTQITWFLATSWLCAAAMAWTIGLTNLIALQFSWHARLLRSYFNTMPTLVSCYGAVLFAAWAINEARERERRTLRASQLEAQLQAARLSALRARLQPHFLYNTLNGIAALVYDMRRDEAGAAIEQLSELLHASLRDDGRDEVAVRDEIALAERYLALQQMRFGDRLTHTTHVAPEAAGAGVPVLLLQPLVENAVVHGLEAGQERLHISLVAERSATALELRVENDGPRFEERSGEDTQGHGLGLAATRARLETAYGDRASLELLGRDGGGVIVRVRIPR